MKVGEIEIQPVFDAIAKGPPTYAYTREGASGKGARDEDWIPHAEFLNDAGELEFHMGGYLVRSGDRLLLVDAGIGPDPALGTNGGILLDSLATLGVAAADITDVVLTHLHFDHIGWVSPHGTPVFPNATFRCDRRDWDHFVGTDEHPTRVMTAVTEQFEAFDGDVTLAPGVDTRLTAGHTPGSSMIVLSSGAERALLVGDVVHCPLELLDDEWDGIFDVDPVMAKRARNALARELEGSDVPVAAAHFPGLRFGRLLAGQGRRSWRFD